MAAESMKTETISHDIYVNLFCFPPIAPTRGSDEIDELVGTPEPVLRNDRCDEADEWENCIYKRMKRYRSAGKNVHEIRNNSSRSNACKKRACRISARRLSKMRYESKINEDPVIRRRRKIISLSDPQNVVVQVIKEKRKMRSVRSVLPRQTWADQVVPELGLTHRQIEDLQSRELTPEDYDLLCSLADSVPKRKMDTVSLQSVCVESQVNDSDGICVICMEDMRTGTVIELKKCHHRFHKDCISIWLTEFGTNCPSDGKSIDPN